MTLAALPIPTKLHRGEGVGTYSRRHANRNHSDPLLIEKTLRRRGLLSSHAANSPDLLRVWRELGGLPDCAFTAARDVMGHPVVERQLCLRCCRGAKAYGRTPRLGLVCLRHKRWVENHRQIGLREFPAALAAERWFRSRLALRGALFDSHPMLLAVECAGAAVSPAFLRVRAEASKLDHLPALLYPEQVKIAGLLVRKSFLDVVADPRVERARRLRLVEHALALALPNDPDGEPWRALNRLWSAVENMADAVRQSLRAGTPVAERHPLLRFSSFCDATHYTSSSGAH